MKMKMKTTLPLILPDDMIMEILLRLPVRTLLRFKCVCKSWLFLISNPQFTKSHFNLAAASTCRLLMRLSENTAEVNSIDIEAPLHDDTANVVFNIPYPSLIPRFQSWGFIVGSCRGFILLSYRLLDVPNFVIWNPSTGIYKQIKNVPMHPFLCGIGYDSSTDDYVIVNVTLLSCTKVHCFSSRTNIWSSTKFTARYDFGISFLHGLFINGALHWLVFRSYDNVGVIFAYDVMERSLSEIPLPDVVAIGLKTNLYSLSVMRGCLCIFSKPSRPAMLELWTLKEYKVQSSWTKSSFVLSSDYYDFSSIFSPLCFTRNGEIWGSDHNKLVRFNDKGELLESLAYGEMDCLIGADCVMYRESLLPLPVQAIEDEQEQQ